MAPTIDLSRTQEETDAIGLGRLFDEHQARLYRFARRLTRDAEDARDLVQETFLRAARRWHSVPPESEAAGAWLNRVLVNLCRDGHRRGEVRRRHADEGETQAVPPSDAESRLVARETVTRALDSLPARQRAAVVLFELEGLSTRDTAVALGVSEITVRWNLSRARKRLACFVTAADQAAVERGNDDD